MKRFHFAALLAGALATGAGAQVRLPRLPVIVPLGNGQPPPGVAQMPPMSQPMLQSSLIAAARSDTVYFPPRGTNLDANAMATLSAQARWLLVNPFVSIRLEGHGDNRDNRDYALAIGEKRAGEVRDFLVLQGVAPARISVTSWGKERPGTVRIGPSVVAAGPRVTTVVR